MDIRQSVDQVVGPIRPFLYVAGLIVMAIGLAKFFGANINVLSGQPLEIAFAGFLIKSI